MWILKLLLLNEQGRTNYRNNLARKMIKNAQSLLLESIAFENIHLNLKKAR